MTLRYQLFEAETAVATGVERRPASRFLLMLSIGVPMGLTQLVQFSISTVDVLMIGRLGPDALAGASLGLVILYAVFLVGFGPAMEV